MSPGLSDTQNTAETGILAQQMPHPIPYRSNDVCLWHTSFLSMAPLLSLHLLLAGQGCGLQLEPEQISIPRKQKLSVPTGPFSSHSHGGWMMA